VGVATCSRKGVPVLGVSVTAICAAAVPSQTFTHCEPLGQEIVCGPAVTAPAPDTSEAVDGATREAAHDVTADGSTVNLQAHTVPLVAGVTT